MRFFWILLWRELLKCFCSSAMPIGLVSFSVITASLAFYLGGFYESNKAILSYFFAFHPWLYLFILPMVSSCVSRLDQECSETAFLMTMPISVCTFVLTRFACAWLVVAAMLLLTSPMIWTVNYLGNPDNGVIASCYVGSWLMAGVFLAVGCCASAMTNIRFTAYLLTLVTCFLLLVFGMPFVSKYLVIWLDSKTVGNMFDSSLLNFYELICCGILNAQGLLVVISLIVAFLSAAVVMFNFKKQF